MEVSPSGTLDPSPFLFDSTFYAVSGILGVAAVSNHLISPVDAKYYIDAGDEEPHTGASNEPDDADMTTTLGRSAQFREQLQGRHQGEEEQDQGHGNQK